jgi:hypothetical protein
MVELLHLFAENGLNGRLGGGGLESGQVGFLVQIEERESAADRLQVEGVFQTVG